MRVGHDTPRRRNAPVHCSVVSGIPYASWGKRKISGRSSPLRTAGLGAFLENRRFGSIWLHVLHRPIALIHQLAHRIPEARAIKAGLRSRDSIPTARAGNVKVRADRGRHCVADRRLQGSVVLVQLGADDGGHPARRHHRRAAGARRGQRRGHPAAAHVHHAADLGDHHALLHLLGGAVRRRHHLDPVQHPGRALVGGDHLRWPSDGPAGPRRRGADGSLHLLVRRRPGRRDADHLPGAADRQVRAAVRPGRVFLRLLPDLRQLRRHGHEARPSRCWPPCAWASRWAPSASTR